MGMRRDSEMDWFSLILFMISMTDLTTESDDPACSVFSQALLFK